MGFEPTTYTLRMCCSTTELSRRRHWVISFVARPESSGLALNFITVPLARKHDCVEFFRVFGKMWRRERDSNPRCSCPHNTLAGCPIRPLWHLSVKI